MTRSATAIRAAALLALLATPAAVYAGRTAPAAVPAAAPEYVLRMHAIKVSNDDGSQATAITPAQVQQWVQKANQVFAASSADIRIEWNPSPTGPDWEELRSTLLNHFGSSSDSPATKAANEIAAKYPGKMVVFFRRDNGAGNTGNGWSRGPQTGVNFIAMPGFAPSTVTGDVTPNVADGEKSVQNIWQLVHDIGHYLNLPHTFPGSHDGITGTMALASAYIRDNGGERSALDGDGIADTPAEAGTTFFANQNWALCSGNNTYTIAGTKTSGQAFSYTYSPARNNIMSYFACEPMTFTAGQVQRMRAALQHPNRRMLIVPPCFADFTGLPAAGFQTCFNYWVHRGLWPVSLASHRVGSNTFFAASFQPGADRPVRTMMTQPQFQQEFEIFRARGFRPDRIHVLATPNGPRFNAIWAPIQGQFEVRLAQTQDQFAAFWKQMHDSGFVNTEVAGYSTPAGPMYAGVWVKRPTQGDATYVGMTAAQYQQRFEEMWANGMRPVRFTAYNVGAETRYGAIWERVPGAWVQRFGQTPAQFQQDYNARAAEGYRLHQVTPLGDRISAIWTKP